MAIDDLLSMIPFVNKKVANKKKTAATQANVKIESIPLEQELPFEKVIGSVIKIEDGMYRAITRSTAVSFDDMDEEDQNLILGGFSDYINGMTRKFQIYIPSFKLDIRKQIEYIDKRLEEDDNDRVIEWLQDDKELQLSQLEENEVIETHFYNIFQVEFRPTGDDAADYLKAKKELAKLIKTISNELKGFGLVNTPLEYEDIGKLLYYAINPFSSGIQEPDFDDNLVISSAKISNKKSKEKLDVTIDSEFSLTKKETDYLTVGGMTFKQKISPYSMNEKIDPDFLKIGSTYMTVYEIYDFRTYMPRLWAKKLYKFRDNIDISIHIEPVSADEITRELDNAAVKFGASIHDLGTKKKMTKEEATTSLDKKMVNTSNSISMTMDALSKDENYYLYSHYILVKAKSVEEMNDICTELEIILGSMRVLFRKTSENMKNALWSILPLGLNMLGTKRSMLTSGVANAMPYVNFNLSHDTGGYLGNHKYNMNFVYFDPFVLDNANGTLLGASGGGKTTTMYKLIQSLGVVKNTPFTSLDPEGEQCRKHFFNGQEISFAESIDGEIVDYFIGSKHRINIFDIEPDDDFATLLKPQVNFLKLFLMKAMPELERSDINKLDYSLIYLYNKFGFTDDKATYWDERGNDQNIFYLGKPVRKPPLPYDLYELWNNPPPELKNVIGDTSSLANRFREWTRLGTNDLFDGYTNVNFKSPRLFINMKHLDKVVKEPALFVLFHKVTDQARKDPSQEKLILTEEAHTLIRSDDIGEYVYDINKRIRKSGGGNIFSTQDVTDFTKTKWGPEIIKNCSWSVLLKQNKQNIDILQELYSMTRSEAVKMTKFNRDEGEAYLVADGYRIPINVKISPRLKALTTTKVKEMREQRILKEQHLRQSQQVINAAAAAAAQTDEPFTL